MLIQGCNEKKKIIITPMFVSRTFKITSRVTDQLGRAIILRYYYTNRYIENIEIYRNWCDEFI